MPDSTLLIVTSAVGWVFIGILSLPAVINIAKDSRKRGSEVPDVYEDQDGKSTPEAAHAIGTKAPKACLLFLDVTGLLLSIVVAVLTTLSPRDTGDGLFIENWICVGAWVRPIYFLELYLKMCTC
jgi:hypothetical protein